MPVSFEAVVAVSKLIALQPAPTLDAAEPIGLVLFTGNESTGEPGAPAVIRSSGVLTSTTRAKPPSRASVGLTRAPVATWMADAAALASNVNAAWLNAPAVVLPVMVVN